MTTNVVALEVMIHYDFKEPLLAWEALQLPGNGVSEIGSRQLPDGNKRLAILGDHALDLVLCSEWHKSEMSKGKQLLPIYAWPFLKNFSRSLEQNPGRRKLEQQPSSYRCAIQHWFCPSRKSNESAAHLKRDDGHGCRSGDWSSLSRWRSDCC